MRRLLKDLTPPFLLRAWRRLTGGGITFRGDFGTWEAASAASVGYDSEEILLRTREAALKVKRGEARMDRDGVAFDRIEYRFAVMSALLRAACARGDLTVLDFGGGLGTTYRQYRTFADGKRSLRWHVVDRPGMAAAGRELFEGGELKFFPTLAEALRAGKPDVVLLSSVLQYLEHPYALLAELGRLQGATLIVDRTPCAERTRDLLSVQTVPSEIYRGSYPCWIFSRGKLESALTERHSLVASFAETSEALRCDQGAFALQGYVLDPKGQVDIR